jgi:hypothetical protein
MKTKHSPVEWAGWDRALKACLKAWLEDQVGDCYTENELATLAEEHEGYYIIWLKAWRLVHGGSR